MASVFKPITAHPDIVANEKAILDYWKDKDILKRSMSEREGGPNFVFYEGPPTANGRPGSHHVIARAFKDMFPRYKTMCGYYVLRKGGWDTHGLPVEIEVEKQLGITHKSEIEAYGIAEFNKKCRESVFRYIEDWEKLTERIAFWVSLEDAYVTFKNEYIQSVWWILKQYWEKGLIYQGYKVVPYCPRCGTPLSSHEVSLGYADVADPSVYVRFKVKGEDNTWFLVWTTTPWTLPGNVALAVGEKIDYVLVEGRQDENTPLERLYLAKSLFESVVLSRVKEGGGYEVVAEFKGTDLVNKEYEPLYTFLPADKKAWYVVTGDFVSTEDGTGIVHMAPAFGADDLDMANKYDLPILVTVNQSGRFIEEVEPVAGQNFKEADKTIIKDLKSRGQMFFSGTYKHSYPHCWRDDGPLMYYARETWYIRATEHRDKLVELNNTINWVPEHIKGGRFGNWLEDVKDWAIGRERYWGTPLPVWICDNPDVDYRVCVGSVKELEEYTGRDLSELDLHRPYVDDITWEVEIDGKKGTMRRVPEVIDVWFDSGAMPFAQWGYPFQNEEMFQSQYPADYICEAVDQTRGWFYSLHAISTMLRESVAFKNVICLGHILDKNGQKMSKSRPETFVGPWDVLDKFGGDAFRWYMYTSGPPGEPRRFSLDPISEMVRDFYTTLWNVFSFFTTYANLAEFDPNATPVPFNERTSQDRWILGELNLLVEQVTQAYENYDAPGATRPIEDFVDTLSNWYLRFARRHFWSGETREDTASYQTLYECLVTLSKLLAPAMPFLAEKLYLNLVKDLNPDAPDSVHLAEWPEVNQAAIDKTLVDEMRLAKTLISLGRAARETAKRRGRQPLSEAAFGVPSDRDADLVNRMKDLIAEELNVKAVRVLAASEDIVNYRLKPVDTLGRELRKDFPAVRKAIMEAENEQVTAWGKKLLKGEAITVQANGKAFDLTSQQVIVQQTGAKGYAVAETAGYVAALQTELTEELLQEGLAREVTRRIQTLRKEADFEISDRIQVRYQASDGLSKAIAVFADYIQSETLADTLEATAPDSTWTQESYEIDDEKLTLGVFRPQ